LTEARGAVAPAGNNADRVWVKHPAFGRAGGEMHAKSFAAAVLLLTIVLVAPAFGQWQPDQRLTFDPSTSATSTNNAWCVATTGEMVYAVWCDDRDGNPEIYHKRSTDGGVDWGSDTRLTDNVGSSVSPSVAVVGSGVHVVWADARDGSNEIYYKRSTDGGENWGSDMRLTDNTGVNLQYASVAAAGVAVHVVWVDYREGSWEICYKRSTDGGETWSDVTRLVVSPTYTSASPSVAASGDAVHVVWYDDHGGNANRWISYKHSTDRGETWSDGVRLTDAAGISRVPSVAASGNAVHVVWEDVRDGNEKVYYKRSVDGGETWGGDIRLTSLTSCSQEPSVAAAGAEVHVVFRDDRDIIIKTYYKHSSDGGETWGDDMRLTDLAGSATHPSVASVGAEVHVVWQDSRHSNWEVYYKRYGRRGGSIAGTAFSDDNGDGDRDPGERGLPRWTIKLEPGPLYRLTDDDGDYLFHSLPAGEYTVSEAVKVYWQQTSPLSPDVHVVTLAGGAEVTGKDFGSQVAVAVQNLTVSIAGGIARPGFQKTYSVNYENAGTVEVGAAVTLALPPDVTYFSSSPTGVYNPGTHSVTWDVGSLVAGFEGLLSVTGQVAVVPIGTELTASVTIEPTAGDANPSDNQDSETEVVRGSYDPNMITVRPEPFISASDILDCTIYFQNVGNDTAFNIIVREMLDPNLDISTIEPLAASHPYAFGLGGPNELIWSFNDVKLVDSTTNEPASHGFLRFRVNTYPSLPLGTNVDNSAAIYFDYNAPVLTNTVRVTVAVPGWSELASMPLQPSNKEVSDGGWLAFDSGSQSIFAAKGNKTPDFFRYDPVDDAWRSLSAWPDGAEHAKPSAGAVGCADGNGIIYATKGNNTPGFWQYNVATDSWFQKASVPLGSGKKKISGGTDIVWALSSGVGYAYLLKGREDEFYRYHVAGNFWEPLADAPAGAGRKWDEGSWLAYDGAGTIYAHRSKHNDFYAYDLASGTWSTALAGMPLIGRSGKKEKSGDGGCGVCLGGSVYALKGGKSQEFWKYTIATNSWSEEDEMPIGSLDKSIGVGADIVAAGVRLYATKGNKSNELWQYLSGSLMLGAPGHDGVAAGATATLPGMSVGPSPLATGYANLHYSLPKSGVVMLSVYDVTGRSVVTRTLNAGRIGSTALDLHSLSAGVYLLKLSSDGFSASQKFVIGR
jgi:hypothetical protein